MIASAIATLARLLSGDSSRWTPPHDRDRQRVFFANHSSHLDFIVIWAALAADVRACTRPVAGADYWGRGPIRRYLSSKVFRAILVERSGGPASASRASAAIEHIAAEMGTSDSIIVFPEGTRSMTGEVLPFKSGIYHLCKLRPELELVPVWLANLSRILPKGEVMPVPLAGRVMFGASMQLREAESKDDFLARARGALLALRST